MDPISQVWIGIAILVVGGLVLGGAKRMIDYLTDAVAAKLIKSINGQLGLQDLRNDVRELKTQMEMILTDLE